MADWSSRDDDHPEVRAGRKIIGIAVRSARLDRGLSQHQLGWRASISQSTISRLESGTLKGLRLRTLARIIGMLNPPWGINLAGEPGRSARRLPGERP